MQRLLQLMVENESPLLKIIVNDLSHLYKAQHLKKLVGFLAKSTAPEKNLETLLAS